MLIQTSEMDPVHDKSKEISANRKYKTKAKHNFNGPRSSKKWDVTASSCPSFVGRDHPGDDEIKAALPLTKQEDVEQQHERDSREKNPGTTRRPKRYAGHNRNIRPGNESKTLSSICAIQNRNVDLFADMRLVRGKKKKDKILENGSKIITDTITNTNGMSPQKEYGGISTSAVSNSNLNPNSSLSFKHKAYPKAYTKSNRTNSKKKKFKSKNKFKSCREMGVDIGKENIESMDILDQSPQDLHSKTVGQDQNELRCINSEMSSDSDKREGNVTSDINDHSSVMTIQNDVPSRNKRNNNNQRIAPNRPRSQNNRSHFEKHSVKFNKIVTSKKGKGSDGGKRQEHGNVPKDSDIAGLGESNSSDTVVTTNAAGAALLHRLSVRAKVDATVVASKLSHNSTDCNSVRSVTSQDSRDEEEDAESMTLADTSSLAKSSHTVEPTCSQQAISGFNKDQEQNIPIPPPSSPSIGSSPAGYYFRNGTNFTQDVPDEMLGRSYNYSMMPSMISAPPYPDNLPQNSIANPRQETASGQTQLPQQEPRPLDQQQHNYSSYCYGGMHLPLSPYGHSYLSYSQCQQFGLSAPMAAPVPATVTVRYQQESINGTVFFTPVYQSDFVESGYENIYSVHGEGQDAGNQSVDGYNHQLIDDERNECDGKNKKLHSQGKIINRKNIKFRKKRSAKKTQ